MNTLLAASSFLLYLIAAVQVAPLQSHLFVKRQKYIFLILASVAVSLHGWLVYNLITNQSGINLGLVNALSLTAWFSALLLLLLLILHPVEKLALVLFPLAGFSLLPAVLFNSEHTLSSHLSWGISLHIALSMLAYGLLAVSFVQALFTSLQDYWLRRKRMLKFVAYLPPLQGMESLFFQLTSMGVFLLSLSLVSGAWFIQDLAAQHLWHKLALSTLAWVIFAWVLVQHWRNGLRVRQTLILHTIAFIILNIGYFLTKLVLELILSAS